jgi:hypothetical protein
MEALGEIHGTEAAAIAGYGGPGAVRRRRLIAVIQPSAAQASSTRRALARLKDARIIVGAGRRRRRIAYRLRKDEERLSSLSLGGFS